MSPDRLSRAAAGVQYLSTRELAARWSIKPATLLAWRSHAKGPRYTKIEGVIRYAMADVIDYENRGAISRSQEG